MTDQPIPVAEAVKAVQAAIEVCANATPGPWRIGKEPDSVDADADFPVCCTYQPHMALAKANAVAIVAARAGYAATLEYLLHRLDFELYVPTGSPIYLAVAPIVAWWRAQGGGK